MGAAVLGVVIGVVLLVTGSVLWQRRIDRVRREREFRHDASRLVISLETVGPAIVGRPGSVRDERWGASAIQVGVLIEQLVGSAEKLREDQQRRVTGALADLRARWTTAIADVVHNGATLPEPELAMITMEASRIADALGEKALPGA
jgi:hypothetical protein